MNIFLSL